MHIDLNDIPKTVEPAIYKRGLAYYRDGVVDITTEDDHGSYRGTVAGSDTYDVDIKLVNEVIIDHRCTCPYDMGPVCKHVVAMALAIRELQGGETVAVPKKKRAVNKVEPPAELALADTLAHTSMSDLVSFLDEICQRDDGLRRRLMARFAPAANATTLAAARQPFRDILGAARRGGFIAWRDTAQVHAEASALLSQATLHSADGQIRPALFTCMAAMEVLVPSLQRADDSGGLIGDCINQAAAQLNTYDSQVLPDEERAMLLEWCLRTHAKGAFQGWDWHRDLLAIAINLVGSARDRGRVEKALAQGDNDYEIRAYQHLHWQLIQRYDGDAAARTYVYEHLDNPDLRKRAIEDCMAASQFGDALQLAQDGVEADKDRWPGLVRDWNRYMLDIAIAQKDKTLTIAMARELYLRSPTDNDYYYGLLKSTVGARKWPAFVNDLIVDTRALNSGLLPGIYIAESRWDDLLELCRRFTRTESLTRYEEHLLLRFRDVYIQLYVQALDNEMAGTRDRKAYQTVLRHARRLPKMGARPDMDRLADQWRAQYRHRPALLEELQRL